AQTTISGRNAATTPASAAARRGRPRATASAAIVAIAVATPVSIPLTACAATGSDRPSAARAPIFTQAGAARAPIARPSTPAAAIHAARFMYFATIRTPSAAPPAPSPAPLP